MRRRLTLSLITGLLVASLGVVTPDSTASAAPQPELHHRGQSGKRPDRARPVCTGVAHVGDSTTVESYDAHVAAYSQRFDDVLVDAGGGRSVFQRLAPDPQTGLDVVASIRAGGFEGCWVVALGTNDTANIAAGANYTHGEAIDAMMGAIDPEADVHVVWVDAFTTKTDGYWHRDHMATWNAALEAATDRWPNLQVIDWSPVAAANPSWLYDGIHHTTVGRDARVAHIVTEADRLLNGRSR